MLRQCQDDIAKLLSERRTMDERLADKLAELSKEPGQEASSRYLRVELAQVRDTLLRRLRLESRELLHDFEKVDAAVKVVEQEEEGLIAQDFVEASPEGASGPHKRGDARANEAPLNVSEMAKEPEGGRMQKPGEKRGENGDEESLTKQARDPEKSVPGEKNAPVGASTVQREVSAAASVLEEVAEVADAEPDTRPALTALYDAATIGSQSSEALPIAVATADCVPPNTPSVAEDRPGGEEAALCLEAFEAVASKAELLERADVEVSEEGKTMSSREATLPFVDSVLDGVGKGSTVGLGFKRKRHGDRLKRKRSEFEDVLVFDWNFGWEDDAALKVFEAFFDNSDSSASFRTSEPEQRMPRQAAEFGRFRSSLLADVEESQNTVRSGGNATGKRHRRKQLVPLQVVNLPIKESMKEC
ncbi:hypothetical protein KFL_001500220 [Klebsormidium nitens]|uniref:Uncharacterized protein n=1 Tax=Klebsormidium nitens TaxID=105231 RepID=A0A1Y1I0K0_KLENI|nr:hypothetical protein KFL_001500220 [Klebsormidium nitens]|eukprot:GAQ83492.1 hypothetical protein KFL_001500220 [Klebsormidium nitens]